MREKASNFRFTAGLAWGWSSSFLNWTLTGARTHCGFFPLWLGVLLTAFFWEMWNYFSYPKWTYHVPWGDSLHVFEMPLLGYGEYLPLALEFYALYHWVCGLLGDKKTEYVKVIAEWFL